MNISCAVQYFSSDQMHKEIVFSSFPLASEMFDIMENNHKREKELSDQKLQFFAALSWIVLHQNFIAAGADLLEQYRLNI